VAARWGILDQGPTAVIEMAAASGLSLLTDEERRPSLTSTYGTGQLISAALDAGCAKIAVGVGGSATNDGGAGASEALGIRFLGAGGVTLPRGGGALCQLERIDLDHRDRRLDEVDLSVAVDVVNPLLGPTGATFVYGPQKGATMEGLAQLERGLTRLAEIARATLKKDLAPIPGAGAAGGLAFGLMAFCGARLTSGFEWVAEVLGLEERIEQADWVLTGEGRLDAQTFFGKGPGAIANLAKRKGKRTVIFAGAVESPTASAPFPFDEVVKIPGPVDPSTGDSATSRLALAAATWARRVRSSQI
jgi:glycerate kinase